MEVTVKAKVLGVEATNSGQTVKLEIPAFRSKFPTPIYGLEDEQLGSLMKHVGKDVAVVLHADRPRAAKDGAEPLDQARPFNWYWSFVRLAGEDDPCSTSVTMATAGEAPSGPPAAPAAAAVQPIGRPALAIAALDAAVRTHRPAEPEGVTATATVYLRWLLTASVPPEGRRQGGSQDAPSGEPSTPGRPPGRPK